MAVDNEKLLRKKILELTALYEISHVLGSTLDFRSAANQVLGLLAHKLDMSHGTVTILNTRTKQLAIEAAHGLTREEIERGKYRIGEGVTGKVVERGEPMIIPDVGKEPLFLNKTKSRDLKRENISFLSVPIKVKGETLGVLSADRLFAQGALGGGRASSDGGGVLVGAEPQDPPNGPEEKEKLIEEKHELATELKGKYKLDNVVGESKSMVDVFKFVQTGRPRPLHRHDPG
jgi:Nif-specific regulatory protein